MFASRRAKSSEVGKELELALRWFLEVTMEDLHEVSPWSRVRRQPIHLWCDARGTPPRVAAVLVA